MTTALKVNPDLTIPPALSCLGREAAEAVLKVIGPDAYTGGCRLFYSGAEWKERGESYCTDAELVLVHDGGCLSAYGGERLRKAVRDALEEVGLYMEPGTGWYTGIYAIGTMVTVQYEGGGFAGIHRVLIVEGESTLVGRSWCINEGPFEGRRRMLITNRADQFARLIEEPGVSGV